MVNIGFDARYVRTDHHDGISRFSSRLAEFIAPLAAAAGHKVTLIVCDEEQLTHLPRLPHIKVTAPTNSREPWVAHTINRGNFDVVFSPMQTIGSWGRKFKLVLTVHDLIYYRHATPPRQFNCGIRLLWRLYHLSWSPQRFLLNRSNAVVAVSQTTRDLIKAHHLTKRDVYVVENAADVPVADHSIASANTRTQSIIYMGSFMPYKNVETLVLAMRDLPGFTLHLLSRISHNDEQRLRKLAPQDAVIFHNGTTDEDYYQLLTQATALVSASRDEGFGIPLVEAMSLGTPIVVSDIPIFHEIGGEAALYAHPDSPQEFARQITSLNNPLAWSAASQASLRQSAQFSWSKSAQELLNVLIKVARS